MSHVAGGVLSVFLVLLAGGLALAAAGAQERDGELSEYVHTAWTREDGAPTSIMAMAQTADGFLWLGTASGLYRFDGVRFELYSPRVGQIPSVQVYALLAMPNGDLWIGYAFGGVSCLHRDTLDNFDRRDGLPGGSAWSLVHEGDTVWVGTTRGLARIEPGPRRRAHPIPDFTGAIVTGLLFDSVGTLWVGSRQRAYRRERGSTRFAPSNYTFGEEVAFYAGPRKAVWAVGDRAGLLELASPSGAPLHRFVRKRRGIRALFVDHDGGLWATARSGLEHSLPASTEAPRLGLVRLNPAGALSGSVPAAFVQDHEGNVWVGTEGGLDRFRKRRLHSVTLPRETTSLSITPADSGAVWVGSSGHALMRVKLTADDRLRIDSFPAVPKSMDVTYRDPRGALWVAGVKGLWRSSGNRFVRVALPATMMGAQSITTDGAGGVWVSFPRDSVYRVRGTAWIPYGNVSGLPREPAIVLASDEGGGTWFGYPGSRVALLEGQSVRLFGADQGLHVGNVLAIHAQGGRTWVGGELGVALLDHGRFRQLTGAGGAAFRATTGIAETNRELWLHGADGISRIPRDEVERVAHDTSYHVRFERFDFRDGLEGGTPQIRPLPTMVTGSDGRLWIATFNTLLWIDPTAILRNRLAPTVVVRSLTAGGRAYAARDTIALPKGTSSVQIDYTALSLSIPDRVRFKYRLTGSDADWQDVGPRRQAFYTSLHPGVYRFRIIGSNEDGVWNETGASVAFVIPPTFVQSRWFLALWVATLLVAAALLYRLRLRQVAGALRARYAAALDERTRIAQELHDSLLQGVSGMTLQLDAVQRSLTEDPGAAAEMLGRVLAMADVTLREARSTIWDLRAPELEAHDLPSALDIAAHRLVGDAPIELRVSVAGAQRKLDPMLETTALRVTREAVTNALKHASPSRIDIDVTYNSRMLELRIRDDGVGFGLPHLEAAADAGHWGIKGMRERAARYGGTVELSNGAGRGGVVRVTLPARPVGRGDA